MRRSVAGALVLALALALPGRAFPQQGRGSAPSGRSAPATPAPAAPAPAPAPQGEPPPAPYEKDLLRLAEIMGSLAFLRSLCNSSDAGEWPKRMQALLDAEGTSTGRRERLAGAYNRGYRGFSLTYRICTASANEATNRYLKEGETLSRNIASRFGG
jgi:uncharacterized protein (TIGR02301 family)